MPPQAAKRVQAPGSFYIQLLQNANALALPISANLSEAALAACGNDADEFESAWLLARTHLRRPSKHMVLQVMRSLAARGRAADAAATGRGFVAGGGKLAPAGVKLLEELEGQVQAQQQQKQKQQQQQQDAQQPQPPVAEAAPAPAS
jgi:hypothetical protein